MYLYFFKTFQSTLLIKSDGRSISTYTENLKRRLSLLVVVGVSFCHWKRWKTSWILVLTTTMTTKKTGLQRWALKPSRLSESSSLNKKATLSPTSPLIAQDQEGRLRRRRRWLWFQRTGGSVSSGTTAKRPRLWLERSSLSVKWVRWTWRTRTLLASLALLALLSMPISRFNFFSHSATNFFVCFLLNLNLI